MSRVPSKKRRKARAKRQGRREKVRKTTGHRRAIARRKQRSRGG